MRLETSLFCFAFAAGLRACEGICSRRVGVPGHAQQGAGTRGTAAATSEREGVGRLLLCQE